MYGNCHNPYFNMAVGKDIIQCFVSGARSHHLIFPLMA